MHLTINVYDEVVKALIAFVAVAVLGGSAATLFARHRYQRELDLSAAARFYDVYGTWFSTWKQWSAVMEPEEKERHRRGLPDVPLETDRPAAFFKNPENAKALQKSLLKAAADCEGQFEALLVKISIERRLTALELMRLARFREGYQRLRECIEDNVDLPFSIQKTPEERSAYAAFKSGSVELAILVSTRRRRRTSPRWTSKLRRWFVRSRWSSAHHLHEAPTPLERSQRNFIEMTSWRVSEGHSKDSWWTDPGADSVALAIGAWEDLKYK